MRYAQKQTRPGFTLIELILVVALTLFFLTVTIQGLVNSASEFSFNNTYQRIEDMILEARSLAISGQAQQDYGDYNKDVCYDQNNPKNAGGCAAQFPTGDLVTPANYGVDFSEAGGTYYVRVFADNHVPSPCPAATCGTEGKFDLPPDPSNLVGDYERGYDIVLDEFQIPSGMSLIFPGSSTGGTSATIFYSPIFADLSFNINNTSTVLPNAPFFQFGLVQQVGSISRKHCSQIHQLAGNSEPMSGITNSQTVCP